jgi:sterol desaturase/sphingolipid hydroxylase (fatty acid hydroxylase superfamily)
MDLLHTLQLAAIGASAPFVGILESGRSRFFWVYLLTGALIAWWVYQHEAEARQKGSFFRYLLPGDIWGHKSARVDLWLILINGAFWTALAGGLIIGASAIAAWALQGAQALGLWDGTTSRTAWTPLVITAYTLCVFVADDFMHFYSHYLAHRWAWLWEFHKIHHSAEVLTPLTADRFHPVDALWTTTFKAVAIGLVTAGFMLAFPGHISGWTVAGVNVLLFAFNLAGGALRHSHIWFDFGPEVDRWVISPAMHQIHHSSETRHWDKNMGGTLSCWDRWFGTLYVPRGKESFVLGAGPDTPAYRSVWHCYAAPFVMLARKLVPALEDKRAA